MLPDVKRKHECRPCKQTQTHKLEPYDGGAQWRCTQCRATTHYKTQSEMVEVVVKGIMASNATTTTSNTTIPKGYRVYLEHHGEPNEREASTESIRAHIAAVGGLPKVGNPLFTHAKGVEYKGAIIPYGKVVRIETAKTQSNNGHS